MAVESKDARKRVSIGLPWLIGVGGILFDLITLNPWISLSSLAIVARTSGWLWRPELGRPLTFVLLYPFRWLPEPWIPLALNLFTAVCAGLALALLARSVRLLRHGAGPDEIPGKSRLAPLEIPLSMTWIPPVLAVMVCGLQLSFWENATTVTGEMVDLLAFAYVIRSLFEFRKSREQRWLSKCVFVYALGMANNWAMIGFFPIFLTALVWIKGPGDFLNDRFIIRLLLWAWAGLSLYLLLPVLQSLLPHPEMSIWTALRAYLRYQKDALACLRVPTFQALAIASLLPLLVLAIRWKSHSVQFGDDTRLGVFLIKATGHLVHAALLLVSLWISLDPAFSPRRLDLGLPMLSYYYVSALVCGYAAGYFLLFASGAARAQVAKGVFIAGITLLCATPALLLWRNLGQVRLTNGPALRKFTRQLYADLPKGKSVVLSDDPQQLFRLRAELSAHGYDKDALLLEAPALFSRQYQSFMAAQFKSRWPIALSTTNGADSLAPIEVLDLISAFAAREPVIYLHPGFGYLYERFLDRPKGPLHFLVAPSSDGMVIPPLAAGMVETNEQIWQQRWQDGLQSITKDTAAKPDDFPPWAGGVAKRLHLTIEQNFTFKVVGAEHSKALNTWGVELQRSGHWREAAAWFQRAIDLNPQNVVARINLQYNRRYQEGDSNRFDLTVAHAQFPDAFDKYDWRALMSRYGPVDEPTFLLKNARFLLADGNGRQAGRDFLRCQELAPDWLAPRLGLAQTCLDLRNFARALELVEAIDVPSQADNGPGLSQVLHCRATALRGLGRTDEAASGIEGFLRDYGRHNDVLAAAAILYAQSGQLEPELSVLETLFAREPGRAGLLSRKGFVELQLARYDTAIGTLSQALAVTPRDTDVRLHRAVSALGAGRLDTAEGDYEELLQSGAYLQRALFGLGAVAWRRNDTNGALFYYRQFLSNSIPATPQYQVATERLKKLRGEPGR